MKKMFIYIILPLLFLCSNAIGQSKPDSVEYQGEYYKLVPQKVEDKIGLIGFRDIKEIYNIPETKSLPNGKWIQFFNTGNPSRIMVIVNDTLNGLYVEFYNNGNEAERGLFENGERIGLWTYRYHDGSIKSQGIEGVRIANNGYIFNIKIGEWKWFFENGNLEKIGYYNDNGKEEGIWKEYYDNGKLKLEENYSNGNYDGYVTEYYNNGQLNSKLLYVPVIHKSSRIKDSTYTFYHKNGKLKEKGSYKFGLKNGLWTTWYDKGVIKSKGHYNNGKYVFCGIVPYLVFYVIKDGAWEYWHSNGKKMSEGEYEFKRKHIETNCEGGADITTFHTTSGWEYWDENGNPVSKDFLIEKGLWHTDNQPMDEVWRDTNEDIEEIPK